MIKVYNPVDDSLRAIIEASEDNIQNKQLKGIDVVNVNFSTVVPIFFKRGDYSIIYDETYYFNSVSTLEKIADGEYQYSVNFEGEISKLGRVQYLFLDVTNRFTKGSFTLTASALDFIKLLVSNLNRVFPDDNWSVGTVIESNVKTIQFVGKNCLEVINQLAEEFDTEFNLERRVVNLYRKQPASGLVLKYGPNEALFGVTIAPQDNSNPVTRLYAYGGQKNIGSNYRNGADRLRMNGSLYIEKYVNEQGGIYEHTEVFEDIFPHRTGKVSAVDSPFVFTDQAMDFDVNTVLMPGVKALLTFKTGLLAGYEFEMNSYSASQKKFTINKNTSDQTVDVPSERLKPVVGDEYVITNILMPVQYIVQAEADLKTAAQKWLDEKGIPKVKYTIVCNPFWLKRNVRALILGQIVSLVIPELEVDIQIRVISISRNLRNPNLYALELADVADSNTIVKLINNIL